MAANQRIPSPRSLLHTFVVASPYVGGTPYEQNVVFVIGHSPEGAVGILWDDLLQDSLAQLRNSLARPSRLRSPQSQGHVAVPVHLRVWGPGRLDDELSRGIWLPSEVQFPEVFGKHPNLWVDLVRGIGRSVLCQALGLESLPPDVTLN